MFPVEVKNNPKKMSWGSKIKDKKTAFNAQRLIKDSSLFFLALLRVWKKAEGRKKDPCKPELELVFDCSFFDPETSLFRCGLSCFDSFSARNVV